MFVISFASCKGGAGKTTLSTHFSYFLAQKGFKVLHLDMDYQSASTYFFKEPEQNISVNNITKLFQKFPPAKSTVMELIYSSRYKDIDYIPSTPLFADIEDEITMLRDWNRRLEPIVQSVGDIYNFLVIDCPPSKGKVIKNIFQISNAIIIPMEADRLGFDGMQLTLNEIAENNEFRKYENRQLLKTAGIAFNLVEKNTIINSTYMEEIRMMYKELVLTNALPKLVAYRQALSVLKTVFETKEWQPAAIKMEYLFTELTERLTTMIISQEDTNV